MGGIDIFENAYLWSRRWVAYLLVGVPLLVLYGGSELLSYGGESGALLGIALVAWPLWQFQVERLHVARRAYLTELTMPEGRFRRWFWRGSFSASWQAVLALGGGALLLLMVISFRPFQWLLVAADAAFLGLCLRGFEKLLTNEIQPEHRRSVGRYWVFWANVALLAVALALLEYYHYGMPDTRGTPWRDLALTTFDSTLARYGSSSFGGWIAVTATVEQLIRHAAMIYAPSLPEPWMRSAVWFGLALYLGTGAWLLTRFFLGAIAIADSLNLVQTEDGNDDNVVLDEAEAPVVHGTRIWPVEFVVVLLSCVLVLVAWGDSLREIPQSLWLRRAVGVMAVVTDPCANSQVLTREARAVVDQRVAAAQQQAIDKANAVITQSLDVAFNEAKSGVDPFLDWYFSLAGDAERFIAMFADKAADRLAAEIQQKVLGKISGLEKSVPEELNSNIQPIFGGVLSQIGEDLQAQVEAECLRFQLDFPSFITVRDKARWTISVAFGSLMAGSIGRRVAVDGAAGLAERSGIRAAGRAAVNAVESRSRKLARSMTAARFACNFSGWLRWLCRGAVVVLGGTVVEVFSLELDEFLHRDEMKAKILNDLDTQRASLEVELRAQAERVIRNEFGNLRAEIDKVFVPARDGV
jgi:hypothetical protein